MQREIVRHGINILITVVAIPAGLAALKVDWWLIVTPSVVAAVGLYWWGKGRPDGG